ncbi:MAG: hypothetical protein EXS05_18065 [Planctomycetaceae bacterium]|nr:hypothetical protein [Planctomycetaceae bacterium]
MPQRNRPRCQRPVCPAHGVPLLVGRTYGDVQYRYCTIEGCKHSICTKRPRPHRPGLNSRPVEVSVAEANHE